MRCSSLQNLLHGMYVCTYAPVETGHLPTGDFYDAGQEGCEEFDGDCDGETWAFWVIPRPEKINWCRRDAPRADCPTPGAAVRRLPAAGPSPAKRGTATALHGYCLNFRNSWDGWGEGLFSLSFRAMLGGNKLIFNFFSLNPPVCVGGRPATAGSRPKGCCNTIAALTHLRQHLSESFGIPLPRELPCLSIPA